LAVAVIQFLDVFKFYKTRQHSKIVLNGVSTVFERGYSYGLLGVNGAGKSTLLRLAAGAELPNAGRIIRTVKVSWPLGFASGFVFELSGRENVKIVARMYGEDIETVCDFVEDFAELGDYIDEPVLTYSSGMQARLAFGLSMAISFDCYLIDEITAVGDARFQQRCEDAFAHRRENSDLIMASHNMSTIKAYCSRGAVLVDGHLLMFNTVDNAIEVYNRLNR
jgi:capsular polysaccharide transport system ATP-binding protein